VPRQPQSGAKLKLAGVELYFDDLDRAREFYRETLGLVLTGETPGHHAQFGAGDRFVCLERKGAENYPSRDKAVLFFEVPDLRAVIAKLGRARIVASETAGASGRQPWAVLHDPEGHNILLLERRKRRRSS
jgi:catechol 2,3-dioxygenase-like lactoylglutathione lyase family enzyme